jgi:hypothetical protein
MRPPPASCSPAPRSSKNAFLRGAQPAASALFVSPRGADARNTPPRAQCTYYPRRLWRSWQRIAILRLTRSACSAERRPQRANERLWRRTWQLRGDCPPPARDARCSTRGVPGPARHQLPPPLHGRRALSHAIPFPVACSKTRKGSSQARQDPQPAARRPPGRAHPGRNNGR